MKRMGWLLTAMLAVSGTSVAETAAADAEQPQLQISQRFAAKTDEVPDFRKHVVPLMGKLGCNGRACHGSFQGQGGFRLSLFGYDFKLDHDNLTQGDYSRVDVESPDDSMFIMKPTMVDPHEGGLRYKASSWEHKVFLAWVKAGAHNVSDKTPDFKKLHVTPAEIVFGSAKEQRQLKVVVEWTDGSREDVTDLARFQTNNSSVAEIDANGLVTATEPGDTHVVAFYDNGVVPIPVIRPVSEQAGASFPNVPTPTKVDELVVQKLRKLGVVPSALADDAQFLRRVSLDMTGTLPSASEVQQFLDDQSPDKRERKIEELLASPAYAAWWTTKLCDFTGNNDDQLNNITPVRSQASTDWYQWIYQRVSQNRPYDDLIEGLVLAKSREDGESFKEYCKESCEVYYGEGKTSMAHRSTMPHYWARRNFRTPEERAIGFAYTFLGIRIQCAQCHKHPFDQWTQDDFKEFTGFFTHTRFGQNPEVRDEYQKMLKSLGVDGLRGNDQRRKIAEMIKEGKVAPMQELFTTPARKPNPKARGRARGGSAVLVASVLGGEAKTLSDFDDPRQPLMDWLREKNNPYFAKAFVNRVWASYFNVGIVEPADDLSLANPPSNAALLDYLAEGFVASGYDMKWVHRTIANSRTYQLSWQPNETNELDEKNFSRAVPRRLPAEVTVDALLTATTSNEKADQMREELDGRSIAIPGAGRRSRGGSSYALMIFGRSIRESNCDCDRSTDASLLQTVYLQNDADVLTMIDRRGGWLEEVAKREGFAFRGGSTNAAREKANRDRAERLRKNIATLQKRAKSLKKAGKAADATKLERQIVGMRKQILALQPKQADDKGEKEPAMAADKAQKLVTEAYLRTLSRLPTEAERDRSVQFVQAADDAASGLRGVVWALLNTKEFIVNH